MSRLKYKAHLFSYRYAGLWWSLEILAESREDAEARLDTIRSFPVQYDGELIAKVPAAAGAGGVFVRLVTWIRNALVQP